MMIFTYKYDFIKLKNKIFQFTKYFYGYGMTCRFKDALIIIRKKFRQFTK